MIDPVFDDEEAAPAKPRKRVTGQTVFAAVLVVFILFMLCVMTASAGVEFLLRVVALLLVVVAPALLGAWMGQSRGIGARAGFFISLLLSWLGLLIVFIIPVRAPRAATKECPYCAERVQLKARVCRYCDRDIA